MAADRGPEFVLVPVDELKVGMYVKLDCHWLKHPFPRNSFRLHKADEIAMIRRLGQVFISVDVKRSDPECLKKSVAVTNSSPVRPEDEQSPPIVCQESEEERAILQKKTEQIQAHLRCQEELKQATVRHTETVRHTKEVIDHISAGREGCASAALAMIESMTDALHGSGTAMAVLNVNHSEDYGTANIGPVHALNVFMVSMMLGKKLELPHQEMGALGISALLHDIGERKVPPQVLAKRAKGLAVTRAETACFELHPEYGRRIFDTTPGFPPDGGELIHQHHERLDGSGYPRGLREGAISRLAQILMVADEYDHLTNTVESNHCLSPTEAFSRLYINRGKLFSELVVVGLIQTLSIYPPGTFVLLSDDSLGMVTRTNFSNITRPIVTLYEPGSSEHNIVVIDLDDEKDLSIKKTLRPTEVPAPIFDYWKSRRMVGYFVTIKDDLLDAMRQH
jgi:HD-GYP domain-containing protein (c-di-GMP phosphodiesterase class II)